MTLRQLARELRGVYAWPNPAAKAPDGTPAATATAAVTQFADWLTDPATADEAAGRLWYDRAGYAQRAWAHALLRTCADLLREQTVPARADHDRNP